MALISGIQAYQIFTKDDEVCTPHLSSILLAVLNSRLWFKFYSNDHYCEFDKVMITSKYMINKIGITKKKLSCWDKKNVHIQPNCIFSALIQYRNVHLPLRHRNVILELSYIYLQYPSKRKNERPIFISKTHKGSQ